MLCNKARNTYRHSRRWLRNPGWAQLVLLLCVTLTRGHLGHSARAGLGWWVPDRVTHMPGTVTGMAGWLGSAGIVRWGSHLWPLRRSWTPHVAAQGPRASVLEAEAAGVSGLDQKPAAWHRSPVPSLLIVAKHSERSGASQVALVLKNPPASAGDRRNSGSIPDRKVRKMPWRRAWQPTPVFLPRECHGQRSLVGSSP